MKKQVYTAPVVEINPIETGSIICATVNNINTPLDDKLDIGFGGGGDGTEEGGGAPRSNHTNLWEN